MPLPQDKKEELEHLVIKNTKDIVKIINDKKLYGAELVSECIFQTTRLCEKFFDQILEEKIEKIENLKKEIKIEKDAINNSNDTSSHRYYVQIYSLDGQKSGLQEAIKILKE